MKIGIINYGSGNLSAFVNVFKSLNQEIAIITNSHELESCSHIIMPGVSAWDTTMRSVDKFRDTLINCVITHKKPFLGVCVGMQILSSFSEEGTTEGLNWINGKVKKLPIEQIYNTENYTGPKLPHMGWNNILTIKNSDLTKGLPENSEFYFLHSYYFEAIKEENVIANAQHMFFNFPVIIQNQNIFGVQFHPEKSHTCGRIILNNFSKL